MGRSRPDNLLHPAVLLALSLTLCGGSLHAMNPGTVLPHRIAERATELTAGQRETVAQLIQCLAEAAKELQKHDGGAAIAEAPAAARPSPPASFGLPVFGDVPAPILRVSLHHLDLPPPAATL